MSSRSFPALCRRLSPDERGFSLASRRWSPCSSSRLGRRMASLRSEQAGFTLIETLVALTVIFGSLLALAYTATIGFKYEDLARQKQTATGIADQIMEQVR